MNALRVGQRVQPRKGENITTHFALYIGGWTRGVGRVAAVSPDLRIELLEEQYPPGWTNLRPKEQRDDPIIVRIAWADGVKLEAAGPSEESRRTAGNALRRS